MHLRRLHILLMASVAVLFSHDRSAGQSPSDSIHTEGVPPIPSGLFTAVRPYRFISNGDVEFQGWLGSRRQVLYLSTTSNARQVFLASGSDRHQQLTKQPRSINWASADPASPRFVYALDEGGNEKYGLFLHDVTTRVSRQFTSGRWNNLNLVWSRDGRHLAFTSNARNGKDRDLYIISPPDLSTGRRVRDADGTCIPYDWSPDASRIVAAEVRPHRGEHAVLLIEIVTGRVQTLQPPPGPPPFRHMIRWSRDGGSLYWLTNRGSEFTQLARYDLATGKETPISDAIRRDVECYDLSDDGRIIAFAANEDGWLRLHLLDPASGQERPAVRLARGLISHVRFRPGSQELAFTWSSANRRPGCSPTTSRAEATRHG